MSIKKAKIQNNNINHKPLLYSGFFIVYIISTTTKLYVIDTMCVLLLLYNNVFDKI